MTDNRFFNRNKVTLGKNCSVDTSAVVGYLTGRGIEILRVKIGDNAVIRSNTVIYTNVTIGKDLQTGHNVVIREENRIGHNLNIWSNSTIDYGCNIGNNVKIHSNVYIAQFTTIEDDVFISPGVITSNDLCPVCTKCMKGPIIKKGAKIGVNATLLPHITIGEGSLIGAGSVVAKDVPKFSLVYGNPAKVIKKISDIKCRFELVERPYANLR